jgi:hypothetical protein
MESLSAFRKKSIREDQAYEQGRIRLPDNEPSLFSLVVEWLDHGFVTIFDPTE